MLTYLIGPVLDWIARTPTAFHLWCAEKELRLATTDNLSTNQRTARERNLDLLRDYRSRAVFPHNLHAANTLAPCFVDSENRMCAVAFLLDASGESKMVAKVTQNANFARIHDMQFAELEKWAEESGLTKDELARIQPGYPDHEPFSRENWETAQSAWQLVHVIWVFFGLAIFSICINALWLCFAFGNRYLFSIAGVLIGLVLCGMAIKFNFSQDQMDWSEISSLHMVTPWVLVGSLCVFASCVLICVRETKRHKAESESACQEAEHLESTASQQTGIKKMDGWD